jgi:hypothetical protein
MSRPKALERGHLAADLKERRRAKTTVLDAARKRERALRLSRFRLRESYAQESIGPVIPIEPV